MQEAAIEKVYTVREAAAILRVSANALYEMCARQEIAHIRVGAKGGKVLLRESALRSWLKATETPAKVWLVSAKKRERRA